MWVQIVLIAALVFIGSITPFGFYLERRGAKKFFDKHGRWPDDFDYSNEGY